MRIKTTEVEYISDRICTKKLNMVKNYMTHGNEYVQKKITNHEKFTKNV